MSSCRYARVDNPCVDRLLAALSKANLKAWVDIEGLYAGEEFWPEIAKAIDSATVLLFVITPASVTSAFCRRELNWAIDRGKRVVPAVCRDVEPALLPSQVAERQWVFVRDCDDPVVTADALRRAIRADWVWLREHARLLVKAEEWRASGYDGSLTLRGRDLAVARKFLARRPPGDARPTQLHREFVDASLRARTSRLLKAAVAILGTLCAIASTSGPYNELYSGHAILREGSA